MKNCSFFLLSAEKKEMERVKSFSIVTRRFGQDLSQLESILLWRAYGVRYKASNQGPTS